jgi:eukaryotic-like serine/threonine-protein kinase
MLPTRSPKLPVIPEGLESLRGTIVGGKYRLGEPLGRGGCAVVYSADALATGETVALKLLYPNAAHDPIAVERLEREAQVAARLVHPNVRAVRDCGKLDDGSSYLAMDLLVGETLLHRLARRGRLPVNDAIAIMSQVLSALDAAHELGFLHRDVSPGNIFLPSGGGPVKLLDFGMARRIVLTADELELAIRTRGYVMGTLYYSAPEQVRGLLDIDGRADVFSAGAVLHFALTGTRPFPGGDMREVLRGILSGNAPLASTQRPGLSPAIDAILQKAMANGKDDRFQTAATFREALLDLDVSDTRSRHSSPPQPLGAAAGTEPVDEWTPLEVDLSALNREDQSSTRTWVPGSSSPRISSGPPSSERTRAG